MKRHVYSRSTLDGSSKMNSEQLAAAAQTVAHLGEYFQDLKRQALAIFEPGAAAARGYITPSEEIKIRQLQLSYWKTRNALFELVDDVRRDVECIDRATPQQFLVALAAAALLVDAARFLRENFHRAKLVRRKLDEPEPVYGIPSRMYDDVQKSLTSPYHAWHLWQATRYFDRHHERFVHDAAEEGLQPLVAIIDRLRERLRPSLWLYLRTRLRVRGRRAARRVGRDVFGRGVYALQTAIGCGMAEVFVRPGHSPSLPRDIRGQLVRLLRPGDVLVVRKEFAATNYFLPGYWPHAALFLGKASDLAGLEMTEQEHIRPRLAQMSSATPLTSVLVPNEMHAWSDVGEHPCVLESMKDGVRIRSVNSPLNSDSIVIIRPLLNTADIATALVQALTHEGKAYDFDFDFCASHRLVCTEVVYRAYEGVAGVQFNLRRHVGRFALAAGDLLRMALAGRHFEVLAVYSQVHTPTILTGAAAADVVRRVEGDAT
jgi:Permuted papain-like amidase enzyme, YaeF/YiiX, C92 family